MNVEFPASVGFPEYNFIVILKSHDCIGLHFPGVQVGVINNNGGYAIPHCFPCSSLVPLMSFLQEVGVELIGAIFLEEKVIGAENQGSGVVVLQLSVLGPIPRSSDLCKDPSEQLVLAEV